MLLLNIFNIFVHFTVKFKNTRIFLRNYHYFNLVVISGSYRMIVYHMIPRIINSYQIL